MSTLEIIIIAVVVTFGVLALLHAFGFRLKDLQKLFKSKPASKTKEKKPSKEKPHKEKVKKQKTAKNDENNSSNARIEKVSGKDAGRSLKEIEEEKKKLEDAKSFKITKKGVAKIHKKALERDSRSLAKIEPVITRGQKIEDVEGFQSFDDFLTKMKAVGDPDEMDDESFRKMFMSSDSVLDDEIDENVDDTSSGFISSESPESGPIDRRLKRYSIDGTHLRLEQNYDNLPIRRPMLPDHIDFTERITGRYSNITMGDVTNRLAPSEEEVKKQEEAEQMEEESDEDIFAKIMERRRRELGLESIKPTTNDDKPKKKEIDLETIVIADAIMHRPFAPRNNKNNK